jgi:Zn ribbon nucleic-acid-binding protein
MKKITVKGKNGTLTDCPKCKGKESYLMWENEAGGHCFRCGLYEKFEKKSTNKKEAK